MSLRSRSPVSPGEKPEAQRISLLEVKIGLWNTELLIQDSFQTVLMQFWALFRFSVLLKMFIANIFVHMQEGHVLLTKINSEFSAFIRMHFSILNFKWIQKLSLMNSESKNNQVLKTRRIFDFWIVWNFIHLYERFLVFLCVIHPFDNLVSHRSIPRIKFLNSWYKTLQSYRGSQLYKCYCYLRNQIP